MVKVALGFLFFALAFPCSSPAATCSSMTKELGRLRLEYHRFVNGSEAKPDRPAFDDLMEILDRIVEVKAEMRKSNCKIPSRPRVLDKDK